VHRRYRGLKLNTEDVGPCASHKSADLRGYLRRFTLIFQRYFSVVISVVRRSRAEREVGRGASSTQRRQTVRFTGECSSENVGMSNHN